jgi:selenocysteine-specific elongation factor
VAVTKADAVDDETLALAVEEARELVPGAAGVPVSGITGAGLDELRAELASVAAVVDQRRADYPTRLFVDRVFSLRGIGTVVTGTLWSGSIGTGDRLLLEPSGREVRARSVQVHDVAVERADAGQRVAVGLPGIEVSEVDRGDALVAPDAFPRSYRNEVAHDELEPVSYGARRTVHHGTTRTAARVVRVGEGHAQLRLAVPVVAARGDRVVLRRDTTLGGAVVLDPAPPRGRDAERDQLLAQGDPRSIVLALVHAPARVEELAARALLDGAELEEGLDAVRVVDDWAFADAWLEEMTARVEERLRARAEASPLEPGLTLAELLPAEPWAPAVLPLLPVERRGATAYLPGTAARLGTRAEAADALERALVEGGLVATKSDDPELARFLEADGRLVRLGDGYVVSAGAYEVAQDLVRTECGSAGEITLARFRDLAGVGRCDAQLLLERMDGDGLTRRLGDRRVLRRSSRDAVRD